MAGFIQLTAGRLEAQLGHELTETSTTVLFELPGKGGAAKCGELQQILKKYLFPEVIDEISHSFGNGLLMMRLCGNENGLT